MPKEDRVIYIFSVSTGGKVLPAYCARAKNGAELRITWKPDTDQCRSHRLGAVVAFGIGVSAVGYGMGREFLTAASILTRF